MNTRRTCPSNMLLTNVIANSQIPGLSLALEQTSLSDCPRTAEVLR